MAQSRRGQRHKEEALEQRVKRKQTRRQARNVSVKSVKEICNPYKNIDLRCLGTFS